MSFTHIQEKLAALGAITNGKEIVVDQTFTGSLALAAMLEDVVGTPSITLKGHSLDNQEDHFRITGYIDLLGHTAWEFELTVTATEDDYNFVLKLLLPGGWKFADSFPELPLHAPEPGAEEDADAPECLVDFFQFSTARLIFSNAYLYDEALEMDLVAGLNFKGQALFRGKANYFLSLLGLDTPMLLSGPVREYIFPADPEHFVGIRLTADLPLVGDFGGLGVSKSGLLLRSPIRDTDLGFYGSLLAGPGLFFQAEMTMGGRPLQLLAQYDPNYTETLNFHGRFTDFAISGLGSLDSTIGGADLQGSLPAELGSLSGIQVTSFGFSFDLDAKTVSSLSLGIGCANTWELIPDWLTLSEIGVVFHVSNPFKSSRSLGLGIQGVVNIQQTRLAVGLRYPGWGLTLSKVDANPLSIGGIVTHFAPGIGDFPDINIDHLQITGNVSRRQLSLHAALSDLAAIPVGNTHLRFDAFVAHAKLDKQGSNTAFLRAELSLGSALGQIFVNIGSGPLLSGTLAYVSLRTLYTEIHGEEAVPDELPDVTFDYVNFIYNYQTGDLNLFASATVAYDKLPFDSAISANVVFNFNKTIPQGAAPVYSFLVNVTGTGPLSLADGFALDTFAFNFAYTTGQGWSLSGDVKTRICDQAVNLTASYARQGTEYQFVLSSIAAQPIRLFGWDDRFSLEWSRLDLRIAKKDPEGRPVTHNWALRLDALLRIPSIANIGGSIELFADGQGKKGLKFKPGGQDTHHFDIADGIGINFQPKEVSLLKDSADASWKLVGSAFLGITGIPGKLGQSMPEKFIAELSLGKTSSKLELLSPFAPFDFPLPHADGKSLGKFVLEVRKLGVTLRPSAGLVANIGLGFPKELDDYFGGDVFRIYKVGDPLSMCLIDTTVSSSGIDLKFVTSPFLAGNTDKLEGKDWMRFDFGEYGKIGMLMPSFKYNMGSQYFEAGGGFKIEKPLFLPLSPLRNFLDAVGLGGAKDIFPEKLPIKGFSLVDANNQLKTEEFIDFLGDVPADVKTTLRGAGDLLDRLPDDFKSYLKLEIPTELTFKFGFAPSGRVSLALHAPNDPIRFLYPGMVPGLVPMPGLIGIELRKLGIGTLASGSLFFGEIDAIIELYDLPALVASLALPTHPGFPLPTSDELRRRILLRDVWALVPLSQGVPVPVPVFYDELGFEYKGLEGVGLQLHLGVPQPDFAAGGTALVSSIGNFLKTRSARLDPSTPPGGQDLRFVFHDEYLEAPEYLGGSKIGTVGKTIEVGTWKYVAQLLNFTKHFLLEDLVAAIPVENRMRNTTQKLGFFTFEATALLSTPEEFDNGAYTQLRLSAAQAADFRTVLPGVQTGSTGAGNGSTGLIAFLRGAVKMSIFELTASLGIAGSDSMGFGTGFKLAGKVGGFLDAELSGALLLNAPKLEDQPITYPPVEQVALPVIEPVVETMTPSAYIAHQMGDGHGVFRSPVSAAMTSPFFTYECWVKISRPNASGRYIIMGREGQFELFFNLQGVLTLWMETSTGRVELIRTGVTALTFNTWTHLSVVRTAKTLTLYQFGAPLQQVDISAHTFTAAPGAFVLGQSYSGVGISSGPVQFSDLRIWKTALLPAHMAAYRRSRLLGRERDLVGYYRFDIPASGAMVRDQAMGQHGTLSRASTVTSDLNLYAWFRLEGHSYLDIRDIPVGGASYTLSVVMRQAQLPPQGKRQNILACLRGVGAISLTAEQLASVTLNTFFAITVVVDQSTRKTFLNETLINTEQVTAVNLASDTYFLNSSFFGTTATNINLPIDVAEFSVWSGAQTDDWVKRNWGIRRVGNEVGLVALFRPAHHDMGRVDNLADPTHPATVIFPDFSTFFQPAGVAFSKETQYGYVPRTDKLSFSKYSICFWFRPASNGPITGTGRAQPLCIENGPRVAWLNGNLYHRWRDAAGTLVDWGIKHPDIVLDKWHYITMTNDGKTSTIWLNGNKIAENEHNRGIQAGRSNVIIGRAGISGTAAAFQGQLDNLTVWNRVLSVSEIKYWRWMNPNANVANLVACYPLSAEDGDLLRDIGPHGLHGKLYNPVGGQTLPATPLATTTERMAIQALGHTHLRIGGHEVMRADMRMNDEEFWFKGKLNLFPDAWGVKVAGDAEGLIRKDSLYLDATTSIDLHGLQLLSSRTRITHERAILTGKWLGLETLLDIQWAGGNPHFTGYAGTQFSRTFELGAIYIDGIKVADNFKLSLDVDVHFGFDFDQTGFGCDARCRFKINGVGFDESFALAVPIRDIEELATLLRQALIDAPKKFLAHVFASALAYLQQLYTGAIEFWSDAMVQAAQALQQAYDVVVDAVAGLAQQAGLTTVQLVGLLQTGFLLSINQIGTQLTNAGYTLANIASGLLDGAGATITQVTSYFQSIGQDVATIANTLASIGKTPVQIGQGLREVGVGVVNVANALKPLLSATQNMATVLKNIGYDALSVARGLKGIGANCGQSIADMMAHFDLDTVYRSLRDVGYSLADLAVGFKGRGYDMAACAGIYLRNTVQQLRAGVVGFLRSGFGDDRDAIANVVKNALDSVAFTQGFSGWLGNQDCANLLKKYGFSTDDAALAMRYGLGVGSSVAQSLLLSAKYAADAVYAAIKRVFG